MHKIVTAQELSNVHPLTYVMDEKLCAGTAVAAGLMMIQRDIQKRAERIQLVIFKLRIDAPPHLAGTGIRSAVSPADPIRSQTLGKHAQIKRRVVRQQHSAA